MAHDQSTESILTISSSNNNLPEIRPTLKMVTLKQQRDETAISSANPLLENYFKRALPLPRYV